MQSTTTTTLTLTLILNLFIYLFYFILFIFFLVMAVSPTTELNELKDGKFDALEKGSGIFKHL